MRVLTKVTLLWLYFIFRSSVRASNDTSNNSAAASSGHWRCGNVNLTDIHIIGFFPCTDRNDTRGIKVDNCDGIEEIPIMRLALEEINGRCDLLPGYRLVVDYANSAVSGS